MSFCRRRRLTTKRQLISEREIVPSDRVPDYKIFHSKFHLRDRHLQRKRFEQILVGYVSVSRHDALCHRCSSWPIHLAGVQKTNARAGGPKIGGNK